MLSHVVTFCLTFAQGQAGGAALLSVAREVSHLLERRGGGAVFLPVARGVSHVLDSGLMGLLFCCATCRAAEALYGMC